MRKLLIPHHTVADWDFQQGALYRSLSIITFVSPPTSLRFYAEGATIRRNSVLCRVATTLCLPQGELRTWLKKNTYAQYMAVFRSQDALGTATLNNCYYIQNAGTLWRLRRVIAGVDVGVAEQPLVSPPDTWDHWRIKYWNGLDPDPLDSLCVEVYKEVAGAWVQQGIRVYDPANQWKDSATNRSGFHCITANSKNQYWDDTEIWGAV